jgi:hypothetical protein
VNKYEKRERERGKEREREGKRGDKGREIRS